MGERESTGGLIALGVVGMGVCCGLPVLLSAGLLGALAGIGRGSWLVIAAGLLFTAVGAARWYQRRDQPACDTPEANRQSREERDERSV